jgi:hypothetical protein
MQILDHKFTLVCCKFNIHEVMEASREQNLLFSSY